MKKDKDYLTIIDRLSNLFLKYLNGKPTDEEIETLAKASSVINKGNKPLLTPQEESLSIERVYAKLVKQVIAPDDVEPNSSKAPKKQESKLLLQYLRVGAVAASIIFVCFAIGEYIITSSDTKKDGVRIQENPMKHYTAEQNNTNSFTLDDGTMAYLNSESQLDINNSTFNKKEREVWLTGEAYFDVTKNQQKPFIVHTAGFSITVHGTSFNVKDYKNLNKYVVSVNSGKVEIKQNGKSIGLLTRNKELVYDKNKNTYQILDKDCGSVNAWTQGRLVLNDADADELRLRLKQYYGADLEIKGNALSDAMINGVYDRSNDLNKTIESICLLYNVKYKIQGSRVTIES